MPDHTWMKDVLIDIGVYADKHGMSEVYAQVALAIEALLPFVPTAALQSTKTNDVVVELDSRRPTSAVSDGDEQVRANRNG